MTCASVTSTFKVWILPSVLVQALLGSRRQGCVHFIVYYESIKRELNKRLIFDSRCDARLKAKAEGSTRLAHGFSRKKKDVLSGRIYDDFSRLLFLHAHREASALANELQEESEQFRFLRAASYANIKGSVGLILAKASAMRISIPLDLSSRPFIPLPRFMRSRRVAPLLAPSLVFTPRRSS